MIPLRPNLVFGFGSVLKRAWQWRTGERTQNLRKHHRHGQKERHQRVSRDRVRLRSDPHHDAPAVLQSLHNGPTTVWQRQRHAGLVHTAFSFPITRSRSCSCTALTWEQHPVKDRSNEERKVDAAS